VNGLLCVRAHSDGFDTQMMRAQEHFSKFYLSKHSSRKLMWVDSLGQCTVKAVFPKVCVDARRCRVCLTLRLGRVRE
jgi:hypothetical protein